MASIVVAAIGQDRVGFVKDLSALVEQHNTNIDHSNMSRLGGEFSLLMMLSGDEENLKKLQQELDAFAHDHACQMVFRDTQNNIKTEGIPYEISVLTFDQQGLVHQISAFFERKELSIEDLSTTTYHAPHTGTLLFRLGLNVYLNSNINIAALRDEFFDFCDEKNLEASFEPIRESLS